MPTIDDARAIALGLPETDEHLSWGRPHWRVRKNGFAWERPLGKKDRAERGMLIDDSPHLDQA